MTFYPHWASGLKSIWINAWRGWFRVLTAWLVTISAAVLSTMAILSTGPAGAIQWKDSITIGGTTEVSRTMFLNLIIFCDLLTVCQDWEFPTFNQPLDVRIAGTFSSELSFNCCPACFRSLCACMPSVAEIFHFVVTGPWLTYGPLLLVMLADLGTAMGVYSV
eukprot:UN4419